MTGWERKGEEGRAAPISLRRKLRAQLLPRLPLQCELSLALGEPVSSWQSLLEEELLHTQ